MAGGLFALFSGLFIQALTLLGVITMNSGHVFMVLAFIVGILIITTEILPLKPTRHKVGAIVLLFGILGIIDVLAIQFGSRPEEPIENRANIQFQAANIYFDEYGEWKVRVTVKNVGRMPVLPGASVFCGFFIREQGEDDLGELFSGVTHEEQHGMPFYGSNGIDAGQSVDLNCTGSPIARTPQEVEDLYKLRKFGIITVQAAIEDRLGKLYSESCAIYRGTYRGIGPNRQPYLEGPFMCDGHKKVEPR